MANTRVRTSKHYFEQDLQIESLIQKENPNAPSSSASTGKDAEDLERDRVSYFLTPFTAATDTYSEPIAVNMYPARFLSYCYYQKYHEKNKQMGIEGAFVFEDGLSGCMNARINGYSALGAAMLAKDVSIDDKRAFIQQLLNYGFELTKKDSALLKLEFCDGLPIDQEAKMIFLLCDHKENSFSMLPPEVRTLIVYCMMRPYLVMP